MSAKNCVGCFTNNLVDHSHECLNKENRVLRAENYRFREALEKIADPRKRDHKEPDAYTELGCVMNIASEALQGRGK
jgi:hypothetical protein